MADLSFEWVRLWPLLLVVPGIAMWLYLRFSKAARAQMYDVLGPRAQSLAGRKICRASCLNPWAILHAAAWVLAILALMQPQFGAGPHSADSEDGGLSLVIALDVSQSMEAEDIRPNRLGRAKAELAAYLNSLSEEGARVSRFGLIIFAGSAQWVMPLTDDRSAVMELLELANPLMIPDVGSQVVPALELIAEASALPSLVLLISDADALSDQAVAAARRLHEEGSSIFGLSIGTRQGARVPLAGGTKAQPQYLQDAAGNDVVAVPDSDGMERLCGAAGGKALSLSEAEMPAVPSAIERLLSGASTRLPAPARVAVGESGPKELFQWPLAASLCIFLMLLLGRDSRLFNRTLAGVGLAGIMLLGGCDAPAEAEASSEFARLSALVAKLDAQGTPELFQRHALLAIEVGDLVPAEISAERYVARVESTHSARAWRDFLFGLCAWQRMEQSALVAKQPNRSSAAWNPVLAQVGLCIRYWRSASQVPSLRDSALRNLERALLMQRDLQKLKADAVKKEKDKPPPPKPPKPQTSTKPPPPPAQNQARPQARGVRANSRSLSQAQVNRLLEILDQKLVEQRELRQRERAKRPSTGDRGW